MTDKKMGRPTSKPKPIRMGIRIDSDTLEKLDEYCRMQAITRSEAVRKAIKKLIGQK